MTPLTTGHEPAGAARWALMTAAVLLSAAALALGEEGAISEAPYVHEDAVLSARQMYSFEVGGEQVNILLGDFSLTVGRRVVSGRDAVVWIRQTGAGAVVRRRITVYVETDARIVEPDGTEVRHRAIFDVTGQKGELRARVGTHTGRNLDSFPLYQRALKVRSNAGKIEEPPTPPEPPRVIRSTTAPSATATTAPALGPLRRAVSFQPDTIVSEQVADGDFPGGKGRITVARGVYLSQGHPDDEQFLEMRSDAAVAYTIPDESADGPLSERIVGVYLEGDVRLRRGERSIRGERLFYDFTTGRALVVNPVFRTIQEQRNIPVYIRGRTGRQLAAREDGEGMRTRGYEWTFTDAVVTTSDFKVPAWSLAARRVYIRDTSAYAPDGTRLSERGWRTRLTNTMLKIGHVPVLWAPVMVGDAEEGHSALRKIQVGRNGRFGWGLESDWYLFRLLGVPEPEGFKSRLESDWYERGTILAPSVEYRQETFSGYARAQGMMDDEQEDDFGTARKNIPARRERGRLLWRHKQFLPHDWTVQLELSYMSDRNFLEEFYPFEFWSEKEQETLLYGKKQVGDYAFTFLGKFHINDFVLDNALVDSVIAETESLPDLSGYAVGRPFWDDNFLYYGEAHAGVVRFRPKQGQSIPSSRSVGRLDLRQEVDAPLALGPVKVLPYVTGRGTYWEDTPDDGGLVRGWGQAGAGASMDIWRVYDGAQSEFWDIHRIKHVITPYGAVFGSLTNVDDMDRVNPFTPGMETLVQQLTGGVVGVRQLWQTKRGPAGRRQTVDWLRLDVSAALFSDAETNLPADGRFLLSRPEYSFPRNAVNAEATWNLSDATTLLADANYDTDSGRLGRGNIGLAVSRSPRLSYYLGLRYIQAVDSSVGTVGVNYQISRKYAFRAFEQYDLDFRGGRNEVTSASIVRKFSRSYLAFTFAYDQTYDRFTAVVSFWPEGVPEAALGGQRMSYLSTFTSTNE